MTGRQVTDAVDNRRPLRIAVVAHLRQPIAAPFMGGMEVHCHQLVPVIGIIGLREEDHFGAFCDVPRCWAAIGTTQHWAADSDTV